MKLKQYLLLFALYSTVIVRAQNQKQIITGTVTSESGTVIPDATVLAIKNNISVISGKKGFHLELLSLPDTLLITKVGYKPAKIAISSTTTNIKCHLEESQNELEEVTINTGYEQIKPNQTNGSYTVISNELLNEQTGPNILDRLKGVTSSLLVSTEKNLTNPQNTTNISIRGLSTINGPLDPLIVLDNFIYEGDINNINPNDVESVTVLKDAAATSIWGARAGNGVIVITTKKGKFNQKLKVDFSSTYTITNKPDLYYNKQISSSDYIDFEQFLFNNGYYNTKLKSKSMTALSPAVEIFNKRREGKISAEDSANQINALKQIDSRDQFTKYFYRKGLLQQYALNLSGGSDNLAWVISGNYNKSVGNLRNKDDKVNLRFDNTYKPFKNAQLNVGLYYSNTLTTNGMPSYETITTIPTLIQIPYLNLVDEDGQAVATTHVLRPGYTDTAGAGYLKDWNYYPYTDWQHYLQKNRTEDYTANLGFQYKIYKDINISFKYQYQKQNIDYHRLGDTLSYYTRDLINRYTQLDRATGNIEYIVPVGGILYKGQAEINSQNFRGQINYNHHFGADHISFLFGAEVRQVQTNGSDQFYYGYTENPLRIVTINPNLSYPTFITGATRGLNTQGQITKTTNRFISLFANGSYSLKQKYILSGSLRRDGSNIFGASTNDKWTPLWSIGTGWIISKETFYKNQLLPYLKLAVTYGVSGNVDLSKTAQAIAASSNSRLTQLPVLDINQINNPSLQWEQSYQTNVRLEFSSINNALNGSIEYYHKKGVNLYGATPYDYSATGRGTTITKNVANMAGNGIDIILNSTLIKKKIQWKSTLLVSYNLAKTTKYNDPNNTISAYVAKPYRINPVAGQPLYTMIAYKWGD
ncbi:SusC/RagA family TonB-linked outer membrane protein [Arachidicoccus ginsenosidivorans]|uniref:SusC/RagA family TonB-linked outer membrane protein n=1 Tax=Arachidicoccus ginsenosidivorans TaxID=496057 RepID=A0A5B8VKW7_9BACT|nr:SusC/RagA family TonB-linked outer membrane protein [Arachidicoccus ginsenosidivorans]QEC72234.1 SusC/RagA family TonB-linked outer membrane protein [Arachidicoccus ginsenosidivorans]